MAVSQDAKSAGGGKPATGSKPTYYFSKPSNEPAKKTQKPKPNTKNAPGVP